MAKFIKFCLVGASNTVITLVIFYMLNKILQVNYLLSSIIGYISGMLNSYILNKRWTFHDSDSRIALQLMKFIAVNSISLGVNLVIMYVFVDMLNVDSMLSQIFATGFSTISSFVGSRFIVFRRIEVS